MRADIYNMKRRIVALFFIIFCSVLSAQVFITTNIQYESAYKLKSELSHANWDTKLAYKLVSYWFPKDKKLGVISYIGGKFLPTSYGLIDRNKITDYIVDFSPCIGIGVGFKYDITEKMKIHIGTAGSTDFQIFQSEHKSRGDEMKQSDFIVAFGITNDIRVRYILSKNVYVDFGAALGLWYANYIYRKNVYSYRPTEITNNWEKKYFKFSAAPFVGLGLKLPL